MRVNKLMTNAYSPLDTTVVILSAGHGTRMLPLTENTPKPLLKVGDLSLIEHHLVRLEQQGFKNIVVNIAYLGEQIRNTLGDGSQYGLNINYSDEADTGALETAGGLKAALPLINSDPFIVVNADIWTDFDFSKLLKKSLPQHARLVMIPNPPHNPNGDFGISNTKNEDFFLLNNDKNSKRLTYSGIGLYSKSMFMDIEKGKQALGPILRNLCDQQEIEALAHDGEWKDIGTPERLEEIRQSAAI